MPRVRLPNAELRDEIRQPLYDTIDILAAENPQGPVRSFYSNVQGKTRSQTNLRQNNLLEATVSFRVQGMQLDAENIYAANRAALPLIQDFSALTLKIGEKDYYVGNGVYWTGRTMTFDAVPDAGPAASFQRYGKQAVQGVVLAADHFIDIPPLQSFRVEWVVEGMTAGEQAAATPAANTRLRFVCSLKGLQRRPVQ